ncbi:hypothetical protein HY419_00985 [candidate division WWE3 bacterium]|nr:hypothetical protein [candidate division WWE3 bacterium]
MFKIYIDTSKKGDHKVTLIKDSETIDEIRGDIDIVSSIKELVGRNKIKISGISAFDMNSGPGSFTGLKAGAAIANILNWAVSGKRSDDLILPEYQTSKFD